MFAGLRLQVLRFLLFQGVQACMPRVAPLGFGILLKEPRGLHWPI